MDYSDSNFALEVSSMDFQNRHKQQFAYRLGEQEEWVKLEGNRKMCIRDRMNSGIERNPFVQCGCNHRQRTALAGTCYPQGLAVVLGKRGYEIDRPQGTHKYTLVITVVTIVIILVLIIVKCPVCQIVIDRLLHRCV